MSVVSVVLPVYNAARFLTAAIDSLLSQTYRDIEVIAVDDGSTDRSRAILADYSSRDFRVRVVSRPNTGIVEALNDGVAAARGEFIARMDADDTSLPHRIEEQVAFLEKNPECVVVGTDVLYTDPEGAPLIRHHPVENHQAILAQLIDGNGGAIIHPSIMFRRAAFDAMGGYRLRYQWIEDLDFYLRLSDMGRLANLPEVHLHYRQHLGSVNKVCCNRDELRMELVNPRRSMLCLPPLVIEPPQAQPHRVADWRRHWAFDAARGGNWSTAGRNAWQAVINAPLDRRNWKCLRYALHGVRSSKMS